ncbi:MAG: Holliday junction resolvase RuvX [Acidobacteria bacterium]|nr:MAG: Holliday junction resolvase RuvX [Acidobacteriota bacterium]PYV07143.1 MAG: Holliday junction resolvase RuvX [Acidobacteriota bacterium]
MSGPSASSGRILAIDFGMKRMGLAVSDALGITAQGLPTLERTRMADDLGRIRELTEEYSVERVILGNPVGHSGGPTGMSGRVAEFAEKLRRRLGCPVELWDERLTSVEAGRMLRQSGMGIEKRKRAVDRVAATLLLQAYLDYHASERARSRKSEESGPEAPGSAEDGQGVDGRTGGVDSGADE